MRVANKFLLDAYEQDDSRLGVNGGLMKRASFRRKSFTTATSTFKVHKIEPKIVRFKRLRLDTLDDEEDPFEDENGKKQIILHDLEGDEKVPKTEKKGDAQKLQIPKLKLDAVSAKKTAAPEPMSLADDMFAFANNEDSRSNNSKSPISVSQAPSSSRLTEKQFYEPDADSPSFFSSRGGYKKEDPMIDLDNLALSGDL